MSLKLKSILASLLLLTLLLVLALSIVVYDIRHRAAAELVLYQHTAREQVEHKLKGIVDVVYAHVDAAYREASDQAYIEKYYGPRLLNIIDVAEAILRRKQQMVETGELSLQQAQAQALAVLKLMRYDDGEGYVWVNDTTRPHPRMLMHPSADLEGKLMDSPQFERLAYGGSQNLFSAFLDVCDAHGGGFVDYAWNKPGVEGAQPKLSYVRLFKPWDWVLGTGIYVEQVQQDALDKLRKSLRDIRYDQGQGYFWVNDTAQPVPRLLLHGANPELEGSAMQGLLYDSALADGIGLGQRLVETAQRDQAGGVVEYRWPKLGAEGGLSSEKEPKLAYVRWYQPLDWVIGSGVYIGQIDAAVAAKQLSLRDEVNALVGRVVLYSAALLVGVTVLLWFLLQRLLGPLTQVDKQLVALAQGALPSAEFNYHGHDEVGSIIRSFMRLRTRMADIIAQTRAIARGNYQFTLQELSHRDQLGTALMEMTRALRQATEHNQAQDWLKSGRTQLHERMRGEQSVQTLAEHVVSFLCAYLPADSGLFYGFEAQAEQGRLRLLASYNFERRKQLANSFRLGEGLVGQVGLEKQTLLVTEAEAHISHLDTAVLLAVPFLYENQLRGVLEFGFAEKPALLQRELLEQVVQDIGIAVNSAESRTQLEILLRRT